MMHTVMSAMFGKVRYFAREIRVVASRLQTKISLKMLSFLARLSVFEDQYTVEKPRVMRIE
jgi:hypothetical protein